MSSKFLRMQRCWVPRLHVCRKSNTVLRDFHLVRKQHAKWKEYEERHEEERKRLREYLAAVKVGLRWPQLIEHELHHSDKYSKLGSTTFLAKNRSGHGRRISTRLRPLLYEAASSPAWCLFSRGGGLLRHDSCRRLFAVVMVLDGCCRSKPRRRRRPRRIRGPWSS